MQVPHEGMHELEEGLLADQPAEPAGGGNQGQEEEEEEERTLDSSVLFSMLSFGGGIIGAGFSAIAENLPATVVALSSGAGWGFLLLAG